MAKKTTKKTKAEEKTNNLTTREYTDEEKARLAKYQERAKKKTLKFKVVVGDKNKVNIMFKDPDDPLLSVKLFEAFGTAEGDIQLHLIDQIAQIFNGACSADGNNNEVVASALGKSIGILSSIQPQNEFEAMLAIQMIAVHNMAMRTMGLAILGGQTLQGKESNGNLATKMLRTFIAQTEVLQKIRTGGQQKMTIKHIHVNEGGQAIVGTVNQGGGVNNKNNE
jgi:hypothetical protein